MSNIKLKGRAASKEYAANVVKRAKSGKVIFVEWTRKEAKIK